MQERVGDIWDYHQEGWIVIPTNLGWRADGRNVMGAGLAMEAATRFPQLPVIYGAHCRVMGDMPSQLAVYDEFKLIMFPVKPLNRIKPNYSFASKAVPALIRRSLDQLQALVGDGGHPLLQPPTLVFLPLVGCGYGGLDPAQVVPEIESRFRDSTRVILVHQDLSWQSGSSPSGDVTETKPPM